MTRAAQIAAWTVVVVVAVAAGLAVAGPPELRSRTTTAELPAAEIEEIVATMLSAAGTSPVVNAGGADPDADANASLRLASGEGAAVEGAQPAASGGNQGAELRPPEEVKVLVANGTSVAGAAARLSGELSELGYQTLVPVSTVEYPASQVWFDEGWGAEAAALADLLGVFPEEVMIMPASPGFPVGEAAVVLIVGPDLAGS